MLDSIENQINQSTLEQKDFSPPPTFKNRKNRKKILVSVALIILFAVGIVSSLVLLGQKQDNRQQASVSHGLVNIKLKRNVDCAIGQTCYVDVLVNTGSSNIDALQAKVVFDKNSINSVENISFKPTKSLSFQKQLPPESGVEVSVQGDESATKTTKLADLQGETPNSSDPNAALRENTEIESSRMIARPTLSLVKNEVTPSKEIMLAWTLMSTNAPFNSNNGDYLLGRIEFVAKQSFKSGDSTNNMVLSLDPSFSKATLYKTGQDSLNTPSPLTIALNIEDTNKKINCENDSNCPSGQYCYQPPMPTCPEGVSCMQVMPEKYCKENTLVVTKTPTPTPTPVELCKSNADCETGEVCSAVPAGGCPTITIDGISRTSACASAPVCRKAEGIRCQSDKGCFEGYTCYQPPMPTCPEGVSCMQVMPEKYCKENTLVVTKTPTPVVSVSVKPSATPTPVSCAIPSCKNGVLKLIKPQYKTSRDLTSGGYCPIYVCEEPVSCQYDYSAWSECNYGVQTRTISSYSPNRSGCSAPILKRSCNKPCSSDNNCSQGEICIVRQVPQTTMPGEARISNMGYCGAAPTLSYDLNGDGLVNVLDLSIVIKNLFTNNVKADVNKDKVVDIADYSLVLKNLINRDYVAY